MNIKAINSINQNYYNKYNEAKQSYNSNKNPKESKESQIMRQNKDEYIASDRAKMDYNPNDTSLSITFADKNTKTIPTVDIDKTKTNSLDNTQTSTAIHTDVNGTRFLVVSTTVGNQTFEKSIKLSENL
jgi:hypothetical protein